MPSQNEFMGCYSEGDYTALTDSTVLIPGKMITADQGAPRLYVYHSTPTTYSFQEMSAQILHALINSEPINRNSWQTLDVSKSPAHDTFELRNTHIFYDVPDYSWTLNDDIQPDQPWADIHFLERIGGEPLNPAPSYRIWPHHNGSADRHVEEQVFSHTYPERFWPKRAAGGQSYSPDHPDDKSIHRGIRYDYGDLAGVVEQLRANSLTRQAVLPMWFPEDTGATDRRVPCSIAYHFMADDSNRLSVWYYMRACDFARHFHNDCYFAARLLQWVCARVGGDLRPGQLNITISSLHLFRGDADRILSEGYRETNQN
ncbi:MAG: thymidylate synthase [Nitrospira sp.]